MCPCTTLYRMIQWIWSRAQVSAFLYALPSRCFWCTFSFRTTALNDAQHHWPSGEWKSKLQQDNTSSLTRMDIIPKIENKKWWGCRGIGTLVCCWFRMSNGVTDVEHNLTVSWMVKYRDTIWPGSYTPRYIPNRNENMLSHKDLYTNVHGSIIHDGQDLERTHMFNWWMGKQM